MKHEGMWRIAKVASRVQIAKDDNVDFGAVITIKQTVQRSVLRELFDEGQLDAYIDGVYDKHGKLLTTGITELQLDVEFSDCRIDVEANLTDESVALEAATVKGIRLRPQPGGMIGVRAAIYAKPTEAESGALMANSGYQCRMKFQGTAGTASAKAKQPDENQQNLPLDAGDEPTGEDDPVFDDAVKMVLDAGQVDREAICANFDIGWGRCDALLDAMADRGFISSEDDKGHREVILKKGA